MFFSTVFIVLTLQQLFVCFCSFHYGICIVFMGKRLILSRVPTLLDEKGVLQSNFRIFKVLSVIVRNQILNTFGPQ